MDLMKVFAAGDADRIQQVLTKEFSKQNLIGKLNEFCQEEIFDIFFDPAHEDIKNPSKETYDNLLYELHKNFYGVHKIVTIDDPHKLLTDKDFDVILNDEHGKYAFVKKGAIIVEFVYKAKKNGTKWDVEAEVVDIDAKKLKGLKKNPYHV